MTNAELAILSLIVQTPCHGYEIEQTIAQRGMREWTEIGFSSIYYILRKLERSGSVQSRVEHRTRAGPARRVYHVTPAGLAAWHDATLQLLSEPSPSHQSFLLGLSNLPGIPRHEAVTALRHYAQRLSERRQRIENRAREQAPLPRHVEVLFEFSQVLIDAQLRWLQQFTAELQAGEVETPPAG